MHNNWSRWFPLACECCCKTTTVFTSLCCCLHTQFHRALIRDVFCEETGRRPKYAAKIWFTGWNHNLISPRRFWHLHLNPHQMQITAPQLHLHILLIQLVGLKKNWNSSFTIAPSSVSAGGLNKNSSRILMLRWNKNSNSSSILPILLQSHQQNVKKNAAGQIFFNPTRSEDAAWTVQYTHRYIFSLGVNGSQACVYKTWVWLTI